MRCVKVTLSLPDDLKNSLYRKIPKREVSKYVANAVIRALQEDEKNQQLILEAAYREAQNDPDRLATLKEWNELDRSDTEWEWTDDSQAR